MAPRDGLTQLVLFRGGRGGYHTYRIPALLCGSDGTLLAFCEGRRDSASDAGTIHLLLRRSADGGRTWGTVQVVAAEEGVTCGNPCPVLDPAAGRILLPFCKNPADGPEGMICAGKAPRTVWLTYSDDSGATWTPPREITREVKRADWTWYATGPGHGVALRDGRLVVPCDHVVGVNLDRARDPHHSHVVISDDGGETWRIGGILPEGTNECAVVETPSGDLYINCRNHGSGLCRAVAWSRDGGEGFFGFHRDPALVEPRCQASLASVRREGAADHILFANPAATARVRLTVRLSDDGGRTWSLARTLHAGPSAYSDLAGTHGGAVCCLYEGGREHPYETLTLARFDLRWLAESSGAAGRVQRREVLAEPER